MNIIFFKLFIRVPEKSYYGTQIGLLPRHVQYSMNIVLPLLIFSSMLRHGPWNNHNHIKYA